MRIYFFLFSLYIVYSMSYVCIQCLLCACDDRYQTPLGTPVEHWADNAAFTRCNRKDTDSTLYNAMIFPYVVGPMAVTGFTWYQGESNTGSAQRYACCSEMVFPFSFFYLA